MLTEFFRATLKSGEHLENLGVAGKVIQKPVLKNIGWEIAKCFCFRKGARGELHAKTVQ
jgi:hypothetical protein